MAGVVGHRQVTDAYLVGLTRTVVGAWRRSTVVWPCCTTTSPSLSTSTDRNVVVASSSSVYGRNPTLPKREGSSPNR
jgi:hypothetical protein